MRQLPQLRQEFIDSLHDRFNIIDIIVLVDYDQNFDDLKNKLMSIKKDPFTKNDRIVFLHFDTEYYIHKDKPGLLITNLISLLTKLDIPAWFTLLITNQPQVKEKVIDASKGTCDIAVVFCNFQKLLINQTESIIDLPLGEELIEKNFVCLNGARRFHRKALVRLLEHNNLIEKGIVSYKP